ncbi:hypothetical protein SY83_16615 [Paenibacillus swuensis]|uniref:Xylose isomerase-like TIM barrel domain-containing protein n=1 Tax=Paenibacillus swuensis TaxID=1178515 RepID=A0A172TKS3_9BACL|nr:TIM barrel protein [Paenibacillus swuensis]ANE47638.1 hypothetical protein SY83_16615 [Paenibacillus swuensis]
MKWSVNSWTFERHLGPLKLVEWNEEKKEIVSQPEDQPAHIQWNEWPASLAEKGYHAVELSYAHIPSTTDEALLQIRKAYEEAGIEMASILLDYGDISHTDVERREADIRWIRSWIDYASKLGALRVRVIGGESAQEDQEALQRASEAMRSLISYGLNKGVQVVTENNGELLSTADYCLALINTCEDQLGFTADYGNFKKNHLDQLEQVLPIADTVHAKMKLHPNGEMDTEDFSQCLRLTKGADFDGVLSLTYLGDADPWTSLAKLRAIAVNELRTPLGIRLTRGSDLKSWSGM